MNMINYGVLRIVLGGSHAVQITSVALAIFVYGLSNISLL